MNEHKCMVCDISMVSSSMARHLKSTHNIKIKDYYNMYIKKENEGLCIECNSPTTFYTQGILSRGYKPYCDIHIHKNTLKKKKLNDTLDKNGTRKILSETGKRNAHYMLNFWKQDNKATRELRKENGIKSGNTSRGRKKEDYEYLQKHSDRMKEDNPVWNLTYEQKEKMAKDNSIRMKEKIASGEFTPNITNSWTHKRIEVNGKKFRSAWEGVFHLLNPKLDYETIRIPYVYNENKHSYIIDFIDENKKILYEIKPSSLKENPKNLCKFKFAKKWCMKNDYKFVIISNDYFNKNAKKIDYGKYNCLHKSMKQFLKG